MMQRFRTLISTIFVLPIALISACTLLPVDGQGGGTNSAPASFPTRETPDLAFTASEVYYQAAENNSTVQLTMLDGQGNIACRPQPIMFDRGESIFMPTSALEGCISSGSMIVTADRPIIAMSDLIMTLTVDESELIKYNAYIGTSSENTASSIYVSDLYSDAEVVGASIFVQNASDRDNQVDFTLLDQAGTTLATETYQVAVNSSQPVSIRTLLDGLESPDNEPLSAIINAEESVAVAIATCRSNLCIANSGLGATSDRWFVPGLLGHDQTSDPLNLYSTMSVVNVEEHEAAVRISFGSDASPASHVIPPSGTLHLTTGDFPPGFQGGETVEVQSDNQLLVTAQYMNFIDGQGAAYNAIGIGHGGTDLFLPRIHMSETTDAVLYLQNLSDAPSEATLTLYPQEDSEQEVEKPFTVSIPALAPYEGRSVDVKELLDGESLDGWAGAMLIEGEMPMGAVILSQSNADPYWAAGYSAVAPGRDGSE